MRKSCLLIISENFDKAIINIDNALKLNKKDYPLYQFKV